MKQNGSSNNNNGQTVLTSTTTGGRGRAYASTKPSRKTMVSSSNAATAPAQTTNINGNVVQRSNMAYNNKASATASSLVNDKTNINNNQQNTEQQHHSKGGATGRAAQSSRRNVPSHLFHPAAHPSQQLAIAEESQQWGSSPGVKNKNAPLTGAGESSSKKKLAYISVVNQQYNHQPSNVDINVTDNSNVSSFQQHHVVATQQSVSAYQSANVKNLGNVQQSSKTGTNGNLNNSMIQIISRDNIQPPPVQQKSTVGLRQGSTGKRRSVLQNQYIQAPQSKVLQINKGKSQRNNYNNLEQPPAALNVQHRLQEQIENFKTMGTAGGGGSLEKLPIGNNRKNSSLSRRDHQLGLFHNVSSFNTNGNEDDELLRGVGGGQRRKKAGQGQQSTGSVPRGQKKKSGSSNLRNVQTTLSNTNNNSLQENSKIRVQRGSKTINNGGGGMLRIGQKYGYKYGNNGGPLEAYSTAQQYNNNNNINTSAITEQQQKQFLLQQQPNQQIYNSIEGRTTTGQKSITLQQQPSLISKKLSAHHIHPQTIQISQDLNPLNLQHLSSIDRAQSIDSACYDFSTKGFYTAGGAAMNPISAAGLTPKTGKASDQSATLQGLNPLAPGFSEMLLQQTILSRAAQAKDTQKRNSLNPKAQQPSSQETYAVDAQLEAALLSLDQSQVTQNLMKELFSGTDNEKNAPRRTSLLNEPSSNRLSGAGAVAGQQNANSRLELIQQLILRKEITQSPNIHHQQRRPYYNTGGQVTVAHQSIQSAHDQIHYLQDGAAGGNVAGQLSQVQEVKTNNFANSLHGGDILPKQDQHHSSAEDLLRIGRRQDERSGTNGSPQRAIPVKLNRQPQPQQHLVLKTFRPSQGTENSHQQQQKSQQQRLFYSNQYAAASFGQISGTVVTQPNQLNMTENTGLDLNLSDTFGFPPSLQAGQTQQIGFGGNQTFSAISNSVTHEANTTVGQQLDLQTIDQSINAEFNNSSSYHMNNRQKFLSLDQPQLPNTKTALASDNNHSIGDVYHKTLSAYQNDINRMNEMNRARKELSTRLMKQQYILQSIQGAATKNGAPSSASAVLIDSVANNSTIQQGKEPFSVVGGGTTASLHEQQHPANLNALVSLQQQHQLFQQQLQPLAMSQAPPLQPMGSSINYNTVIVADQSHRGSLVDSTGLHTTMDNDEASFVNHRVGAASLEPPKAKNSGNQQQTQQQATTSPIVGRYRLKHVQQNHNQANAKSNTGVAATKRQYQYEGQSVRATTDKRTKSVRPRRPNGQGLAGGGSNMRGGGRKNRDERELKQQTMGTGVRNKFDSIAQAYHSTTQYATGRDDYTSNSQRSFGAITTSGVVMPQQIGIVPADHQQMVTLNPSQQQLMLINPVTTGRQMQTLDPAQFHQQNLSQHQQKSSTLQQTYGVAQKLSSTSTTGGHAMTGGAKRTSAVTSVPPRQRQRASGFNSNLRPPVSNKNNTTERSLSTHNRNRAQHSFKQTNSFVAQHTYLSVGSGASISSQQQAATLTQQLHGSVQYPVNTTRGVNVDSENIELQSAVSPINTHQNRSFKYRAKQVAPAPSLKQRTGKGKSGRGALVANSTQLVGPASRKQSRIIANQNSSIPNRREVKQTQLSQQQAQELRGSLLQHQVQPGGARMGINFSRDNGKLSLANPVDSAGLSPERPTAATHLYHQHAAYESINDTTPEPLKDLEQMSPEQKANTQQSTLQQQHYSGSNSKQQLKLINKITKNRFNDEQQAISATNAAMDLQNEVSVGGQEIAINYQAPIGPADTLNNTQQMQQMQQQQQQPLLSMRAHNLRYSSAVNDFSSLPPNGSSSSKTNILDDNKLLNQNASASQDKAKQLLSQPNQSSSKNLNVHSSELSQEAQERQNQAMKLINEDNPFANPPMEEQTSNLPHHSIVMLRTAKGDTISQRQQVMSFGVDDSNKSIAEKTTERESKNTNMGVSSSAAASGAPFTFSKQSQQNHRGRLFITGATSGNSNNPLGGSNIGGNTLVGRRSLLGMAAMRRSETTEDSQQCMYNDGALIMSSLPMPMHSIKQVIAEEEAAEEQDERTTNKEKASASGNQTQGEPSSALGTAPIQKNKSSGNQSSSNKEGGGLSCTPKISSSDNVEQLTVNKNNSSSEPPMMGSSQQLSLGESIKDETHEDEIIVIPDAVDKNGAAGESSLCQLESNNNHENSDNLVMMVETPNQKSDCELIGKKKLDTLLERPQSQKQSDRYSTRNQSEQGNPNLLCDSDDCSVQHIDDSVGIDNFTPDILMNKNNTFKDKQKEGGNQTQQRGSYNRGAFAKHNSPDRTGLLADYPPLLSESSMSATHKRKSKQGSDAHSDDEVEVRRGLESEHARTDMGSNPELLRQSTHSLLHKQGAIKQNNPENKSGDYSADMLILRKKTKHGADSDENFMISDEINIDLSRSGRVTQKENAGIIKPVAGQAARNNNYFADNPNDGNNKINLDSSSPQPNKTRKVLDIDSNGEEEEDEGIVGQVDDAEEFKLGKVI